tara:strand:- start:104 stop:709 length:606 start_codon:yes stop_codon:yes gene_type:complete
MKSNNRYEGIDNFTIHTIRKKARSLIKKNHFPGYECEDLEQELLVYLLTRLPLTDLTGNHTKAGIIKKLIDERAIQLLRKERFKKRHTDLPLLFLFDVIFYDEEIGQEILRIDTLPSSSSISDEPDWNEADNIDCEIDINAAIKNMPPVCGAMRLDELCELLGQMSVNDISRFKNISRDSIYRALSKVRRIFKEKNLNIYL